MSRVFAILVACIVTAGAGIAGVVYDPNIRAAFSPTPIGAGTRTPQRSNPADIRETQIVIDAGHALDERLPDFRSAHIDGAFVGYEPGGHGSYCTCGNINFKNEFGGYTGWRIFCFTEIAGGGTHLLIEGLDNGNLYYPLLNHMLTNTLDVRSTDHKWLVLLRKQQG
ncbi:MAG TPA: hypothetical protein VNX86_16955 [Rhizomicrobium sp.]|jgi:hypothetical protein|nr:hypothetical protein [Rhizomicrobium sp.]